MLKQELINIRKDCMEYQVSISSKLNELIRPLQLLNIEWFGYGKFFLDEQSQCNKFFWINSHVESFNWYCRNAVDNGMDFTAAIRQTRLNEINYFFTPFSTNDHIVKALRELFDLTVGLSIYIRRLDYIELWDFSTTQENSILSQNALNNKTIEMLSKYIGFFKEHSKILELIEENAITFETKINLSPQVMPDLDYTKFLEAVDIKTPCVKIHNKFISFSKREWETLHGISQGKTIKETATILNLSPRTIESYLDNIRYKTGYRLKADLIKLYQENVFNFFEIIKNI